VAEVYTTPFTVTLASAYTAGASTISVSGAAPSAVQSGTFRVRLANSANTVLVVTNAGSGTTWNVSAEFNDANAASGATVYGCEFTPGGLTNIIGGLGPTVTKLTFGNSATRWDSSTYIASDQSFTGFKHMKIRLLLNRTSTGTGLAVALSSDATKCYQFSAQNDGNLVWYYYTNATTLSVLQASNSTGTNFAGNTFIEITASVIGTSSNQLAAWKDLYYFNAHNGSSVQITNQTDTHLDLSTGTWKIYLLGSSSAIVLGAFVETW
jgi:hypothetical protein